MSASAVLKAEAPVPTAPAQTRPTLLIVDDDPEVLQALVFMAGARGFAVEFCTTSREAIAVARARQPFACLVIDQMLGGDRGLDLLTTLRGDGIEAPAVLMTTAPSATLRRRAAAFGAPVVEKPLLDEALFTEIDRLLRKV